MKIKLSAAVALSALALAGAASASPDQVEIKNAVARVVVVPEARSDVAYEIRRGRADLPPIQAHKDIDGRLVLDGGLGTPFFHECSRRGGPHGQAIDVAHPPADMQVKVSGHAPIALADAPAIILHTPKTVRVKAGEAVFGAIQRADSVELRSAGCGDWTVDNVSGRLSVSVAGSGDVHATTAGDLDAHISGSGDVYLTSATRVDASIAGSGDVRIKRVSGDIHAHIAGSGDVDVAEGHAPDVSADIAGSGDVRFGGEADRVDAHIVGSGDVNVRSVRGEVHKAVVGSGSVNVGR